MSRGQGRLRVRHRLRQVQRHQGRRHHRSVRGRAGRRCRCDASGRLDMAAWLRNLMPDRHASAIRSARSSRELLAREVHDPGIGFLTHHAGQGHARPAAVARVYYTTLGDEKARRRRRGRSDRATPFLRRQIGQRLRLQRVPELEFFYDESIDAAGPDRADPATTLKRRERARRPPTDAEPPTTPTTMSDPATATTADSSRVRRADLATRSSRASAS